MTDKVEEESLNKMHPKVWSCSTVASKLKVATSKHYSTLFYCCRGYSYSGGVD
jgi:hypothetical protein